MKKSILLLYVLTVCLFPLASYSWKDLHKNRGGKGGGQYGRTEYKIKCDNGRIQWLSRIPVKTYKWCKNAPQWVPKQSTTQAKGCFQEMYEAAEYSCRTIGST
jgi:hypothetical protein